MAETRFSAALWRKTCVATALAVLASSGAALAEQIRYAQLTQVQGTVLVDTGAGFVPVSGDVELKLGDRVMVADGGAAVLAYTGNCAVPLQSPSMTTVIETACTVTTQDSSDSSNGGGQQVFVPIVLLGSAAAAGGLVWFAANQESSVSP